MIYKKKLNWIFFINYIMDYKDVELNNKMIRVYKNGNVHLSRTGQYSHLFTDEPSGTKEYNKTTKSYYIRISINNKKYFIHRIVAWVYLGLDIKNTKLQIDHNNHDTEDNSVENLKVCTQSQNMQNGKNTKGYCWNKQHKKYQAYIKINRKPIFGGYFNTEEEAHARYLELKAEHHDYYRDVICSH
jgi:hypothetical protein